jgi:hypothetical protein
MGALGEIGTRTEVTPNCGVKIISVTTDAEPHAADTLTVDLKKYGCRFIHGLLGFRETTAGSIIVTDQPIVTAVSDGVLTITIPSGANDKIRDYLIFAYS